MLFKGRNRVRYNYARWGYTRGGGKVWHGGIDIEGVDDDHIMMPLYNGNSISGTVITARIVTNKNNKTWEWGYYVCVKLDNNQTPDLVNYLYFCHCKELLVKVGDKVKSGDVLAIMGNTGNAADANPPYAHCHFEVRSSSIGRGMDPSAYAGFANKVGTYGTSPSAEQEQSTTTKLQTASIGPMSAGDAMKFWQLAKELKVPYKSTEV